MRINCRDCQFYRPARPLSQLLTLELGLFDTVVSEQLVTIMREENRAKGDEAQIKVELYLKDADKWEQKPIMSDYCGVQEKSKIYFINEIKNAGGNCDDFKKRPSRQEECTSCKYQSISDKKVKDTQALEHYRQLAITSAELGQGGDGGLQQYMQHIGSIKAFEASQSFNFKVFTFKRPQYLSVCEYHSTTTEFVPCIIQNPNNVCSEWELRPDTIHFSSTLNLNDPLSRELDRLKNELPGEGKGSGDGGCAFVFLLFVFVGICAIV